MGQKHIHFCIAPIFDDVYMIQLANKQNKQMCSTVIMNK